MRRLSGSRQVTVYSLSNRRASVAAVVTKPVNEKMGKRVDQYIFRAHLDFKTSPMLGGPVIRQGELGSALFNYLSFAPLLDALWKKMPSPKTLIAGAQERPLTDSCLSDSWQLMETLGSTLENPTKALVSCNFRTRVIPEKYGLRF